MRPALVVLVVVLVSGCVMPSLPQPVGPVASSTMPTAPTRDLVLPGTLPEWWTGWEADPDRQSVTLSLVATPNAELGLVELVATATNRGNSDVVMGDGRSCHPPAIEFGFVTHDGLDVILGLTCVKVSNPPILKPGASIIARHRFFGNVQLDPSERAQEVASGTHTMTAHVAWQEGPVVHRAARGLAFAWPPTASPTVDVPVTLKLSFSQAPGGETRIRATLTNHRDAPLEWGDGECAGHMRFYVRAFNAGASTRRLVADDSPCAAAPIGPGDSVVDERTVQAPSSDSLAEVEVDWVCGPSCKSVVRAADEFFP